MPRLAFIDAITGALKAHGFSANNEAGDLTVSVADNFSLEPGKWRWDGAAWIAYIKPPTQDQADSAAASADVSIRILREMTPTQAAAWVETNINTFADQKLFDKTIAKILCVLARRL